MLYNLLAGARAWIRLAGAAIVALALAGGACTSRSGDRLTLAGYTTPREAYGEAVLPAFAAHWAQRSGREVRFRESYLGSGAQVRAVIDGFEADVAALALEPEIDELVEAGLVDPRWKHNQHRGIVTRSLVVIGVREGNPKNIRTWEDLARPGLEVLTPNVRTSGGAMWSVLAIYGAAMRAAAPQDSDAAVELLASILRNVEIMDRGARASMLTFERGVGDAIITYENEILVGRSKGERYDYVIPPSTILIENPIAVIDAHTEDNDSQKVAREFVEFTWTTRAQRLYAEHGLRPVVEGVASEMSHRFPVPADLFTVRDLGGWPAVLRAVFAQGGVYDRALARSQESAG